MQPSRLFPQRVIQSRYRRCFTLSLLALLLASIVLTPTAVQSSPLDERRSLLQQHREDYRQALDAIDKHKFDQAQALFEPLKSYPLFPYLKYQWHRAQLNQLDAEQLTRFKQQFTETPLPTRLEQAWLHYLAKRQRWQQLLDNYQPQQANTSLQCQRLWALHKTGNTEQALKQTRNLWVHGSSRPKACDRIFKAWLDSDHFTEQAAWDRFWLALERGNVSLAKYASKRLQKPRWQKTAEQALRLHHHPDELARVQLDPQLEGYSTMVLHSLDRLGRKDPKLALKQLERFVDPLGLQPPQQLRLQRRFGLRLLKSYRGTPGQLVQQLDPEHSDQELQAWRLRNYLLKQDWEAITTLLDELPSTLRYKDRWRYWKARALESQAGEEPMQRAAAIYAELSHERSFYGFMAADKMGQGYRLNNRTAPADRQFLEQLQQQPAIMRARELLFHGQRNDARREWYLATRDLDPEQHHFAAQLARQWGWHEQSIRSAISARKWDDLLLRFPLAYSNQVRDSAHSNRIEPSWVFAITRQESAFAPDARSHAGAMGLMQLMPRTAKETARKARVRYRGSQQLVDPQLNLKLGSHYLGSLNRRYEGHRVLASAAYNAGPHRVKRWLEQRKALPIDIWIETIPFDETRNYVQNVLSYAVIYSDLLGAPRSLLAAHEQQALIPEIAAE